MLYREKQIKEGIKLHLIKNERFKTNLIAIFLTMPLERENITKNAMIPIILRRGSKNMPTQEDISKKLEEMYGAIFDCGIEKKGENHILKFYLESINDEFLPENQGKILKESIDKLLEIVFNPLVENEEFNRQYIEQEKINLKQIIEGRADNKSRYALDRCIEEMYKNTNYALYKYGYIEDLEKIDAKNLYTNYKKIIEQCNIDIYVSGIVDEEIINYIEENINLKNINDRKSILKKYEIEQEKQIEEKTIFENLDVNQGKLIMGLKVPMQAEDKQYDTIIYNSILGGSANSKLFQNVREKASLAYTANSSYIRMKNTICINCGIEFTNYEKAVEIIKTQLEEMKNGNFSEEDVENAKRGYIAAIKSIEDEQDTEIMYYFGQEFTNIKLHIKGYEDRIAKVKKEDIIEIAKIVKIDTIYFLQDGSVKSQK
mgnify:FL=1